MTGYPVLLLVTIFISALICILGRFYRNDTIKIIFKPLTTLLIILLALLSQDPFSYYHSYILAGLAFALLGDILLMFQKKGFLFGMIAFAFALVSFSVYCMQAPGPYFLWGAIVPVFIYVIVLIFAIVRRMGNLKIPAIVYVVIMSNFILQAAGRAWYIAEDGTVLLFVGAILFALSDTLLSYDRFVKNFRFVQAIYLTLYWASLTFIALSIY